MELLLKPFNRLIQIDSFYRSIDDVRPKGFVFSGEWHDCWELVLVVDGEAVATGDERVYHLGAGDLLFHKPMEFHRIASHNDTAPRLINLSFTASGEGMKAFEKCKFTLDADFVARFCRIAENVADAERLYEQNDPQYDAAASLAAARLEHFLLQLSSEHAADNLPLSKEATLYRRIVLTMNEHSHRALSVDQIAALCSMSTSNMKRIFCLFSDVAPAKFFLRLRLRRAMQLLDAGESVGAVADALDFSDTAYFCTAFRREMGLTPSQYRKRRPL